MNILERKVASEAHTKLLSAISGIEDVNQRIAIEVIPDEKIKLEVALAEALEKLEDVGLWLLAMKEAQ